MHIMRIKRPQKEWSNQEDNIKKKETLFKNFVFYWFI